MGIAMVGTDLLSEKAAIMRESLQKSQTITDNVVTILGSFDHRLSTLEAAMRPTQIRTHSIRQAHENIDKTLKAAEIILSHFDQYRQAENKILKGPHEDLENYLEAIAKLRSNIQFFGTKNSFRNSDGVVSHASSLLTKAISKLQDEFNQLLSSYSKPVEPERLFDCLPNSMRPSLGSPGHEGEHNGKSNHHADSHNNNADAVVYTPPVLILPRILPLLHDIAQQIIEAGHRSQLLKIYREARSNVLEESLQKLGVEKLNKDDVQKLQWEILEAKIGNWIHFMRIAVKLLFAGERKVCDQIFEGFDSLAEQCFAEVTTNSVSMLLSFGDAIAKSKRSPEKLFVLLDMYEIMQELHSEIDTLFKGKACSEIRDAATDLTTLLAQTAQETLGDFEEAVDKDATKTAVTDVTVHPWTSYVINYVKSLFDYRSTLKQLFQEFEGGNDSSQLATVTMRIMQALQINLDGKSKQYKDPALKHLFLMSNIHYIVTSVRRSEANYLLGDDWVQRHRTIVEEHANQYKTKAWAKILRCMSIHGFSSLLAAVSTSCSHPRSPSFQLRSLRPSLDLYLQSTKILDRTIIDKKKKVTFDVGSHSGASISMTKNQILDRTIIDKKKKVTFDVGSHSGASISMTKNQAENNPSSMPTTEPPSQNIDQGDKDQCGNIQSIEKTKTKKKFSRRRISSDSTIE